MHYTIFIAIIYAFERDAEASDELYSASVVFAVVTLSKTVFDRLAIVPVRELLDMISSSFAVPLTYSCIDSGVAVVASVLPVAP